MMAKVSMWMTWYMFPYSELGYSGSTNHQIIHNFLILNGLRYIFSKHVLMISIFLLPGNDNIASNEWFLMSNINYSCSIITYNLGHPSWILKYNIRLYTSQWLPRLLKRGRDFVFFNIQTKNVMINRHLMSLKSF